MHYYKFEIATWHLHTSHLSLIEEAVYFRLINYYYDTELPIPNETQPVIRRLRLTEYADIVEQILQEFFEWQPDGWHQKHCNDKIFEYHNKATINKTNGSKGGRPKKKEETQPVISGNPDETLIKNKELGTINKELLIKNNNLKDIDLLFGFEDFWSAYDYKKSKPVAQKEWKKLNIDDLLLSEILHSVHAYVRSTPDKKFRKHPSTWIHQKCWEDDITESKPVETEKERKNREFYENIYGKKVDHDKYTIDAEQ